jgi:flagellar motility protein MotE (MotC chaperone)
MPLNHQTLEALRQHHPAWRLLRSDHAALVAAFLERVFIVPNCRVIPQAELAEALEDDLYALRERLGTEAFPKTALDYLNDWASPDKAWMRKFYVTGTDEPQFDLTPATEKAIAWLGSLTDRHFVGTESRLLTLFALLREMSEGTETDPEVRVAELQKRRLEIDREIQRILTGDVPLLDDTALKERFQQFNQIARELLGDFRQVEQNFRTLDRRVREQIARWEGNKGALLEEIMSERDAIADSDQGRSFRAFWDFLMSQTRQEELTEHLEKLLQLPPIQEMEPDPRTRRLHYDWLEAGEHTQRTVAELSAQLRRFLDDQAWLENRRIMEILHAIESRALEVREVPPEGEFFSVPESAVSFELPMERPMFKPSLRPVVNSQGLAQADAEEIDPDLLFQQFIIDKAVLRQNIRQALQQRSQISLRELVREHPLEKGLAELVTYFQMGASELPTHVDETQTEVIEWWNDAGEGDPRLKKVRLPLMIFMRNHDD